MPGQRRVAMKVYCTHKTAIHLVDAESVVKRYNFCFLNFDNNTSRMYVQYMKTDKTKQVTTHPTHFKAL